MIRLLTVLCLVAVACSTPGSSTTTTVATTTTVESTTTTTTDGTTTTEPLVECPPAPYRLDSIPTGVGNTVLDHEDIEADVWTSVGGSRTTFWGRSDGTVAIALIRGALPAVDWPGEKGETFVDGTRAAVGPHPDGTWVMGWYEEPRSRCDLYTMVFYPPISPSEVESTILGMVRVAG